MIYDAEGMEAVHGNIIEYIDKNGRYAQNNNGENAENDGFVVENALIPC